MSDSGQRRGLSAINKIGGSNPRLAERCARFRLRLRPPLSTNSATEAKKTEVASLHIYGFLLFVNLRDCSSCSSSYSSSNSSSVSLPLFLSPSPSLSTTHSSLSSSCSCSCSHPPLSFLPLLLFPPLRPHHLLPLLIRPLLFLFFSFLLFLLVFLIFLFPFLSEQQTNNRKPFLID